MKKFLLIAVCSCWIACHAQTGFRFADSTAQWNILVISTGGGTPPGETHTEILYVVGDIIINGKSYQHIGSISLRRDSLNRIYEYSPSDTNEFLLYDFSKQAGDTILGAGYSGHQTWYVVDSVDSVLMGYYYRKRMYIRCPSQYVSDIWIDGIGQLYTEPFVPEGAYIQIPESPSISLLCFFEHGQLLYHNITYDTCFVEVEVGIKDIIAPLITIYPNPANDKVQIILPDEMQKGKINIFDIAGEKVKEFTVSSSQFTVDVSGLSKGMYYVTAASSNSSKGGGQYKIARTKLIVE